MNIKFKSILICKMMGNRSIFIINKFIIYMDILKLINKYLFNLILKFRYKNKDYICEK